MPLPSGWSRAGSFVRRYTARCGEPVSLVVYSDGFTGGFVAKSGGHSQSAREIAEKGAFHTHRDTEIHAIKEIDGWADGA